jgi:putative ABC transport system permease protein
MYLIIIALRRLAAQASLGGAALVALSMGVTLAISVAVYADAASLRLLRAEFAQQEAQRGRPALALLARYLDSASGPLAWERFAAADQLMRDEAAARLGLPLIGQARHARSSALPIALEPTSRPLLQASLGFWSGMEPFVRLIDGTHPAPPAPDTPLDILITHALAEQVGLNVGDELYIVRGNQTLSLRVSGIWVAHDPTDPAWFYDPAAFNETLLIHEAAFSGPFTTALPNTVAQMVWFARYADTGLHAAVARPLAGRVAALNAALASALPGARLEQSPATALERYQRESDALTAQLLAFGAPVLALILGFVTLTASQIVDRQRPEIALLKSRGVQNRQILMIALIEWLVLGSLALVIGVPLGIAFAALMGQTSAFLRLDGELPSLALALTSRHLIPGGALLGLALSVTMSLAYSATQHTLVDQRQHTSRTQRPRWQRTGVDLLLLGIALYGLSRLQRDPIQLAAETTRDLTSDPLLIAIPTVLSLSLGLLTLRCLPPLFSLLARLIAQTTWIAPLIALRNIARQPALYRGVLLLLILTLSLAVFSAAAAATIDSALRSATAYRVGATTQLLETGDSTERRDPSERRNIRDEPRFVFVPVAEHLLVPGIRAASRVGQYAAELRVGNRPTTAQLIGIDRLSLPEVLRGFERAWIGNQPLNELLNRLAATPNGVLVGPELLANGANIGDRISITATVAGDRHILELVIVGVVPLFPGFYPQDGPLLIAELDTLFDQMGGQYPYDVWIDRDPAVPLEVISAGVRERGINLIAVRDATELLRSEQTRPQRQGLFGLLSLGFISATGLTVISFVISTVLTAQQRAVELGVLRAMGLDGRGVAIALALEPIILTSSGLVAGLGSGLAAAWLIVPQLQVGSGPHPGTPPTSAIIAWNEIGLTALLLGGALSIGLLGVALALRRTSLLQAVKLG